MAQRNPIMHCQEAYDGVVQVPTILPDGKTMMSNQRIPNQHYWLQNLGAVLKELPNGDPQWVLDNIGKSCARCMAEMSADGNLRLISIQVAEAPESDSESKLITP